VIDTGRFDWSRGPFEDVAAIARKAGAHAFLAHLRSVIARDLGGCPAPQSSFLMLQGLDTLSLRLKVHCENALALAQALADDPRVAAVGTRAWPVRPILNGHSACLAGEPVRFLLCDWAVLPGRSPSSTRSRAPAAWPIWRDPHPGDSPGLDDLREYQPEDRLSLGVSDDLVRASVGLEPFPVILADFRQALASAEKE